MTTHELKCWPEFFADVESGAKPVDIRKGDDRTYAEGDWIKFREYAPEKTGSISQGYTGRFTYKQIVFIMHGGPWLPQDVWVLCLR